jgi:non-heme chloroperoxidase
MRLSIYPAAILLFFGQHGYRVIAHDRRGHGRSSQTWDGNEMNTYADDLATLFKALNLRNAFMVGHSTGGGEVARYLGRHGSKRVAKAVLLVLLCYKILRRLEFHGESRYPV